MKGNRTVVTAVVVIAVLIVGWWLFRRAGSGGAVDLLTEYQTTERKPDPNAFAVADATLNGETKKAIAAPPESPGSRITWKKVRVPDDGWLRVSVGLSPDVWTEEGDGVLFMVLVSDGKASDQLFTQVVNPFGNAADRRWIPVTVDLSAYGGEEVDLIFNTFASQPGKPGDVRHDKPLWGAPEIVIR